MSESLKSQLLKVPPEKLIELLFEFAGDKEVSWSKIERLVARPKENASRFSKRLRELKSRGGFVSWKYSSHFGAELTDLLKDIESANPQVEEGFKLICDFYEADKDIFEQCDDSSGNIGDVFRSDALDLYAQFAKSHPDRKRVIKRTLDLVAKDGYGVRDYLISSAYRFLDKNELKQLFDMIEAASVNEKREYARDWKLASIAKQLGDAPLYEKLHLRGIQNPNGKLLVEVAEVYFNSGDLDKAQEILNRIPSTDAFSKHDHEELQKKIFLKQGKSKELFELVHKAFITHPSEYTLKDLKVIVQESDLQIYIDEAKGKIFTRTSWDTSSAEFLCHIGSFKELSDYILKHQEKIDGTRYYSLPDLAERLIKNNQLLAATVLLRALIEGTVSKAKSKTYHHAVGYLLQLEGLAKKISDWSPIVPHDLYFVELRKRHALKKSFWSRYQEEK